MKGIYYPMSDFLHAAKGRRPSWAWSSLLQGREILLRGVRWQVSDGSRIQFWDDCWLPSSKDFKIHTARPPDCPLLLVRDFIDQRTKSWKEGDIRRWVSKEEAESILSIPFSQSAKMDFLVWHLESKGNYSVKTGYHVARESHLDECKTKASSSFQPPQAIWKFIWSINIPPKLKHFWWKTCCNFLATKENLFRRKCHSSPICSFCQKEPESIEHLLFRCGWTSAVWFGSCLNYKVDSCSIPSVMK